MMKSHLSNKNLNFGTDDLLALMDALGGKGPFAHLQCPGCSASIRTWAKKYSADRAAAQTVATSQKRRNKI